MRTLLNLVISCSPWPKFQLSFAKMKLQKQNHQELATWNKLALSNLVVKHAIKNFLESKIYKLRSSVSWSRYMPQSIMWRPVTRTNLFWENVIYSLIVPFGVEHDLYVIGRSILLCLVVSSFHMADVVTGSLLTSAFHCFFPSICGESWLTS